MIKGMNTINKYMRPVEEVRGINSEKMPKINIYEQAGTILKSINESIQRFNDTLGEAASLLPDAIPVGDEYDGMVDANDLPALAANECYILKTNFNQFVTELVKNVDSNLNFTISTAENVAKVLTFRVVNDVNDKLLYINDQLVNFRSYIQDGISYFILPFTMTFDLVTTRLDEIFHQILQSDELNRINASFLSAICRGEANLDVVMNRLQVEFADCMDESKRYLQLISSNLGHGIGGFMMVLKQMFGKVVSGTYDQSSNNITFTDNSTYVMRNFTTGIIEAAANGFSNAWSAAKNAFDGVLNVITFAIKKTYSVVSNVANSILAQYVTSKFNFDANNTNFVMGIMQTTIKQSDWDVDDSSYLSFSQLYDYLLTMGPQKAKVPWGSIFFWVNADDNTKIFVEHKLRTDIHSFTFPFLLRAPAYYASGKLDDNSLMTLPSCTSHWGTFSIFQRETAGSTWSGDQVFTFSGYPYQDNYSSICGYLAGNMVTNDYYADGTPDADELSRCRRIENAFLVFLAYSLYFEIASSSSLGFSYSVLSSNSLFEYTANNNPKLYRLIVKVYTAMFILSRRTNSSAIAHNFPSDNDHCWQYLTGSTGLRQSASTYHICSYTPATINQLMLIMNNHYPNWNTYYPTWKQQAKWINGDWQDPEGNPSISFKSVSVAAIEAIDPCSIPMFIYPLVFSDGYSKYNYPSSTNLWCRNASTYLATEGEFFVPPTYNKTDILTGILLIAGVVLGIALVVSIPTFLIKKKLAIKATQRAAAIEGLWSEATKNPTVENVKAYRKAVKKNNLQSKLFGGQIFSKSSYWGSTSDTLTEATNFLSSTLMGNDDYNLTDVMTLISGTRRNLSSNDNNRRSTPVNR